MVGTAGFGLRGDCRVLCRVCSSIVVIGVGAVLDTVLRIVIGVEAWRIFEIVIQSGKKTLDSLDERTIASFSEPEENEDGVGDQKSSPNQRQDIEFKHGLTVVEERKSVRRGACHVCCLTILGNGRQELGRSFISMFCCRHWLWRVCEDMTLTCRHQVFFEP
jgi:hypothetical protein